MVGIALQLQLKNDIVKLSESEKDLKICELMRLLHT